MYKCWLSMMYTFMMSYKNVQNVTMETFVCGEIQTNPKRMGLWRSATIPNGGSSVMISGVSMNAKLPANSWVFGI